VTGTTQKSGTDTTDKSGIAKFCYTSTTTGVDTIVAYGDVNKNKAQDAGEPTDTAEKTWLPIAPATLELSPDVDVNQVNSEHCIVANVRDIFGNPIPKVTVRFQVTGVHQKSGSDVTNDLGSAEFCYTGFLVGADVIAAYADENNDAQREATEVADVASKTWSPPPASAFCEVKFADGGWIVTPSGSKGSFGGNAKVLPPGLPDGSQEYTDHGINMNVKSIEILALTCVNGPNGPEGSIYFTARVDSVPGFAARVDVRDISEPGTKKDTYRIRVSNGYDSGDKVIQGGNIQIHK
jgi:hypothetical protein